MSVFDYEKYRQRQQEIEVRALVALYVNTETIEIKIKCEAKLYGIAFPESLAEDEDPLIFDAQDHDMELTLQCLGELLEEGIIEEVNRLDGRIGYRVVGDEDEE